MVMNDYLVCRSVTELVERVRKSPDKKFYTVEPGATLTVQPRQYIGVHWSEFTIGSNIAGVMHIASRDIAVFGVYEAGYILAKCLGEAGIHYYTTKTWGGLYVFGTEGYQALAARIMTGEDSA